MSSQPRNSCNHLKIVYVPIDEPRPASYNPRTHTDIDEEEDLVELLIHGAGKSGAYLESLGFVLTTDKGRVGITRNR